MFYRNYTPIYPHSPVEKLDEVRKKVAESYNKVYIELNPQPYNCKWTSQNIDVEHLTMWYSDETEKARVAHTDKQYRDMWYTIIEVSTEERSILFPHKHYLRLK